MRRVDAEDRQNKMRMGGKSSRLPCEGHAEFGAVAGASLASHRSAEAHDLEAQQKTTGCCSRAQSSGGLTLGGSSSEPGSDMRIK